MLDRQTRRQPTGWASRLAMETEAPPSPMPPPARSFRPIRPTEAAAPAIDPTIPPRPHFVTLGPSTQVRPDPPAQLGTIHVPDDMPRRSLASPSVAAAIVISIGLLCTIAWCGRDGADAVDWAGLKQRVTQWMSHHVADDDLPYITVMPIAPPTSPESPAEPKPTAQIALGSETVNDVSNPHR
jgi:hypothetical protein